MISKANIIVVETDEGIQIESSQGVTIKKQGEDVWVVVKHHNDELSMSFENFLKLKLLMHQAAEKAATDL